MTRPEIANLRLQGIQDCANINVWRWNSMLGWLVSYKMVDWRQKTLLQGELHEKLLEINEVSREW